VTRHELRGERSASTSALSVAGGSLLLVIVLLVLLVRTARRLRAARLEAELQAMTPSSTTVQEAHAKPLIAAE
jgi:hypothetical protein